MTPYIPRKIIEALSAPHFEGERHEAIKTAAVALVGQGLTTAEAFSTIRPHFDADKTDKEIYDVIAWAEKQPLSPCVPRNGNGHSRVFVPVVRPLAVLKKTKEEVQAAALDLALDFIDGEFWTPETTPQRSKVPIGEFSTHAQTLLSGLYSDSDLLNAVKDYTLDEKGKALPSGGGITMSRNEWIASFTKHGIRGDKAGVWIRPNPTKDRTGTGSSGSITDSDIARFDFMLIESDFLPVDVQLSLYAKWMLPISAILLSGGDSAHAWVKVSAPDAAEYKARVVKILELLKPFGFDQSNKNPSRLSRLAGAKRVIGASGDGLQKLLYINPSPEPFTDDLLLEFEKRISPPFVSRLPMKKIAKDSVDRFEELHANKGKTGLRTGLATFDKHTGGLKRGNLIVLAAHTNAGKSSLALNIASQALKDSKTVALFTLEMDRFEVYDLLICMNFEVNRNVFNTGDFSQLDAARIKEAGDTISKWPLHIFDDPTMSCDQIESYCLKLMETGGLDLIVVDYLQLVSVAFSKENREQQVAQIGRSLRALSRKCKSPVIAVSQLNEEGKIRESRAIAHDAHIVFLLEWEGDTLRLRITKGRSVQKETYTMFFNAAHCKMGEASRVMDGVHI